MTDQTDRDRIITALYDARRHGLGGMSEAQAVGHMADAVLAALPAVSSTGPAPATDRDTLRQRIAAAIWERQNPGRRWADCEYRWQADAEADADAVLAVLPAPDQRPAVARVRALHQPMSRAGLLICAHCSGWNGVRCLGVVADYPCDTITALDCEQAGEAQQDPTQDGLAAPLRAELKPWQLLASQPDVPPSQTERVIGGRRLPSVTRPGQPETEA